MVNTAQVSTSLHERRFAQTLHHGVVVHHDGRLVIADPRYRFNKICGQIEAAAFPVSRQVLRAGFDRAVGIDFARATDADERREPQTLPSPHA